MNMGAVQSGRAGPIRDSLQTGGLFRKKSQIRRCDTYPAERCGASKGGWVLIYPIREAVCKIIFSYLMLNA
jgi:hypothetical protein